VLPWLALGAFVLAALAIDLRAGARAVPSVRSALIWSIVWTAIGAGFAAVLLVLDSPAAAESYLAGFLVEKSLSLDNLFVFAVLFGFLGVAGGDRRRVLVYGIAGAVVLRGLFIVAGAAVLDTFHLATYVLGALLALTAVKIARHGGEQVDPSRTLPMRIFKRVAPGATPAASALVMVAAFDVMFALDSIPAIFAITRDTFVVFAANAFSLLGLQALYWVLADAIGRFRYLNVGLAAVLVFVGAKMALSDVVHPPVWLSLLVIVSLLGAAVGASLRSSASSGGPRSAAPSTSTATGPAPASSANG
jgi:predicted tellurium resistance membrane protein TerC